MSSFRLKLVTIAAAGAMAAGAMLMNSAASLASASYTCTGGSIPGGSYDSIRVEGFCTVDAGTVVVRSRVVVAKGAGLAAAFGGSHLRVGGNLRVNPHAILVLGCEASAFPCFNDDQQHPTMNSGDRIRGSLVVDGALASLVHLTRVGHDVVQTGGGGGVNCNAQPGLQGSPAYATYEDLTVGGSMWILGFRSCWLGLIRATVGGSVTFSNNVVADPDGNEVVSNTIGYDLVCSANSPAPQVGDSHGNLNVVGNRAYGQCRHIVK
jgi:hypothetical protein